MPARKGAIDRDKLRSAVRRLGNEYIYYMLDDAIELLTEAEQDAGSNLSSHIEVSSSRAVVTDSWGDFKQGMARNGSLRT